MYGFINDILYLNTGNNYVFVECIHKQKKPCDSSFILFINGINKTLEYAFYEEYFRNDMLQWIFKIHNINIHNIHNVEFSDILNNNFNNVTYTSYFSKNDLFNNICILNVNITDNNLYEQKIIQKCMVINSIAFLLLKKYCLKEYDNIHNINNIILYIYINGNGIISNMNEIIEYNIDYNINYNINGNLQEVIKEKILLFYNENIKLN